MDNLERAFVGFCICTALFLLFGAYLPLPTYHYENEWKVIEHKGYTLCETESIPEGQTVKLEEFSTFLLFLDKEEPTTVHFVAFKPAIPVWASMSAKFYFISNEGIIYQYPQYR